MAPEATVDLVVSRTTATSDGAVLSSVYIVDNNLANIMTVSFEACEQGMGTLKIVWAPDLTADNRFWGGKAN